MLSITVEREEPLGFVSCFVEYEIDGTVSPYVLSTFESPAEGGEVEVEKVSRFHPITGKSQELAESEWPFTTEEMDKIQEEFAETSLQDYYDAPDRDDYDNYNDYDNEADDYIP